LLCENYDYTYNLSNFDIMTTLTVKIKKDQDVPALEAILKQMGLEFEVDDDDDWGDLPEAAIEGIKEGLADIKAGRTYSHEHVMAEMDKTIEEFRKKNDR
jgi:predicted transcriptional regulator